MSKLYENVFKAKHTLYARTYDTETQESSLDAVKFIPSFFIKDPQSSDGKYKSILTKEPLKELKFNSMKDYKDNLNLYKSSGVTVYGNPKEEQAYIRKNWPVPSESDHQFHTWYLDIEVAVEGETEIEITEEEYKKAKELGIL